MEFEKDVIEESHSVPVLADFWAPWCGPCRFLGPVLEDLASSSGSRWKLVKINTDEYPELMQRFSIMGIPAVKLFFQGQVIAEFAGALPKHQVEQWLNDHLPDERKDRLLEIIQLITGTEAERMEGLTSLEVFVSDYPDMKDARAVLAKEISLTDPARAKGLVDFAAEGSPYYSIAEDIRTINEFLENSGHGAGDVEGKVAAAQLAFEDRNLDAVFSFLIEAVTLDRHFSNDLPRRTCLALFHLLGDKNELTQKYRRIFDMALY